MSRSPIPTYYFVLVVVQKADKFLVVHERKHGETWFLPAGRMEVGETVLETAKRETLEESGVPIRVEGLIRMEHTPLAGMSRLRFIVFARPSDDTEPIHEPNEDSLEAKYLTLEEIKTLPLRGYEVLELFHYVAQGGVIYPLSILADESTPYR